MEDERGKRGGDGCVEEKPESGSCLVRLVPHTRGDLGRHNY